MKRLPPFTVSQVGSDGGRRRGIATALLLVFSSFSPTFASGAGAPPLTGLRGEHLVDGDLTQGTALIIVWASWSPRSRGIVERVNPLSDRWGAKARVLTVNFEEDRHAVEAFLGGRSFHVPVFLDPDGLFSKHYSIATLPGLLVLKDGQIAYRGKLPEDPDSLLADLLK